MNVLIILRASQVLGTYIWNRGHCISVHSANPRGCDGLDGLFGDPQGAQECRVAGAKGGQLVGTRNIHLAKKNWYFSH